MGPLTLYSNTCSHRTPVPEGPCLRWTQRRHCGSEPRRTQGSTLSHKIQQGKNFQLSAFLAQWVAGSAFSPRLKWKHFLSPSDEVLNCIIVCQTQQNCRYLAVADEEGWISIMDTFAALPAALFSESERRPRGQWLAHKNAVFDLAWSKVRHIGLTFMCSKQRRACRWAKTLCSGWKTQPQRGDHKVEAKWLVYLTN